MISGKFKLKTRTGSRLFDIINNLILLLLGFITLYPVWYIVIVSFSDALHIAMGDISFWPKGFNTEAYKIVFDNDRIWRAYLNTITYTVFGTFIQVAMTAMCAYPLSRQDFSGRKFLSVFITITMFISTGMIPQYLIVMNLGLINTIWAVVLPPAISTYNMIVMRTAFKALPSSLVESAYLDGANDITILVRIILPISKAILATITLFYAVEHWNSFFTPMLYLNEQQKYPLQVLMRDILIEGDIAGSQGDLSNSINVVSTNFKYAVIVVSMVPILFVYPFLQKYFTKGVLLGAIKE